MTNLETEPIAIIVNPISGRGKNKRRINLIKKMLSPVYNPQFAISEYPKHASELTKWFVSEGIRIIVAVGGDGTINEVASALVGTNVTLGIIPAGSGNGLARHFSISTHIRKSMQVLNTGEIIQMDVGKFNGDYFFCTCGFGYDARISKRFSKGKSRGFLQYAYWSVIEFWKYEPKKYKLLIDGKPFNTNAFILSVANANQFGNNFIIAPKAVIYDGLLDVVVLKPFPPMKVFRLFWQIFTGNLDKSIFYESYPAKNIQLIKNKKYPCHMDGEPLKVEFPVEIEVVPQQLNIMVPHGFVD